jgi:hypothetical protein
MISSKKSCFFVFIIAAISVLFPTPYASAITNQQLADICHDMESAIIDVSVEYEWYNIPPWTHEELEQEMGAPMLAYEDGIVRYKLSIARSSDANDPNRIVFNRFLFEESAVMSTKDGDSWHNISKQSYNGTVGKSLKIGGTPQQVIWGQISYKKPEVIPTILTPLGFSVLRFALTPGTSEKPISAFLRRDDLTKIDDTVQVVNGFKTVHVDFLQERTCQVFMRVYFSLDHGYTPVKYEYMTGAAGQDNHSTLSIEVHTLEKVREGLWFPTSGLIIGSGDKHNDGFQTTAPVRINQGLKDEVFDIQFPSGTTVQDDINNREYVIKPTEEQFD